jgi:hypothetical protein
MTDKSLYKSLLYLDNKWEVTSVDVNLETSIVLVHLDYLPNTGLCPFSLEDCRIYDYAPERRWRHLDTMQYQTWLVARLPRVINSDGKVSTISVPWADYSDRYTFLFCSAVIQLLQLTRNQTKTAEFFKTSFDVVNAIMRKAVERGLAKRSVDTEIKSIGIDEKSFQRGHQYCTIITDATNKRILEVVAERTKTAAKDAINKALSEQQKQQLEVVTGDMWGPYQNVVKECLPNATYVLDKFHLIKYLNEAIDETRRKEVKQNPVLKNARFALLKNEQNLTAKQRLKFNLIAKENYLVSHVWKARENFKALFGQPDFEHAIKILSNWFNSLREFTIAPLLAIKEMFYKHQIAIANSLCHTQSNAFAERMNGSIQELKTIAKGFRTIQNFRTAILFHYGKLELLPTLNSQ